MTLAATSSKKVVKPFKEQKPFLKQDKRYYGYVSGVGAGKTFSGIVRTIRNLTEWNVGEMGAIVAPTRQMVVNVIIPEMRNLGLFDPPINWEYKSAYSDEPGIHTPQGSRALILSADNSQTIERLRGLNLAWGWIDEEAVVDPRAREILMQRLRTGEYRNMYITTTPKGKNHTYDFFVGDVEATRETLGEATIYETEDRLAIVGVPTSANPHTPQDYKDAMDSDLPEGIRAQEVMGEFVEIGAGVFQRDMLSWIHPDEITTNQLRPIIAVDPAATVDAQRAESRDSDYWACAVVYAYPRKNKIYVTETARRRGMTLQEGCQWIGQIAKQVPQASVVAEANQSQRWLIDALKDHGVYAEPVTSTRNKESRILDLSIPLENGTIEFVDHNAETPADVGTNPPYQELIGELLSFPEGSHDDMVDALHRAVDYAPVSLGTTILGSDPYSTNDEA